MVSYGLYHSLLVISKHRYMATIPQPALYGMVSSTIPQPACHIQASLYGIIDYTTACHMHRYCHIHACHIQASLYGIIDYTTACLSYPSIVIWYHRLYHSLLVISMHRYMVSSTIPQPACHIQASLYGIIDYTTACLSYPSIVIWYHRLYHSLLVISKHRYMVSSTIPQPACHIQALLYGIIDYTTACLSYPSCYMYHRLYHSLLVIHVIWYHRLYHSLLVISKHRYMVSLTIPQPACHIHASLYGIIDYTTACLSYPSIVIWYHRLYHSPLVIF